jgi:hypothetical protein
VVPLAADQVPLDFSGLAVLYVTRVGPMPAMFDGESHPEHIQAVIDSRLRDIDPVVSAFRLRNRYRGGVGTWIVSVAQRSRL